VKKSFHENEFSPRYIVLKIFSVDVDKLLHPSVAPFKGILLFQKYIIPI